MRFLVIGNLTRDTIRTKDREKVTFGGTTSYCSITASRLGCETHVLSRGNSELNQWIRILESEGINVDLQESEDVTHFVNDYVGDKRKQLLLSDAGEIDHKRIKRADLIHLGPVFNEVTLESIKDARKNSKIVSLDAQGFLRKLKNKEVINRFWNEGKEFLECVDLLKIGEYEISSISKNKDYEEVCNELLDYGVKVVELTLGQKGSIIVGEKIYRIPAYRTNTVDPTGCGDVFATAFGIRYFETKDLLESGLFASAAASFVVEDFGTKNIANRVKVEERFKMLKNTHNLLFGE